MPWPIGPPGPVKDPDAVKAISLTEHHDTIAMSLHDRDGLPPGQELCALTCAWNTVIEQEPHRQNARRWGAQFATANRKRARWPDPVAADVRRFAQIGPSVDGPDAAAQHVVAQLREMTPVSEKNADQPAIQEPDPGPLHRPGSDRRGAGETPGQCRAIAARATRKRYCPHRPAYAGHGHPRQRRRPGHGRTHELSHAMDPFLSTKKACSAPVRD